MPFDKTHIQKLNAREDKIRRSMSSYMNNTKWIKLFTSLEENEIFLPVCYFKFIGEENARKLSTPTKSSFDESGIKDVFVTGPFYFNEIEWVEWPGQYEVSRGEGLKPLLKEQNIIKLKDSIDQIALYKYELNKESLKLYGYK